MDAAGQVESRRARPLRPVRRLLCLALAGLAGAAVAAAARTDPNRAEADALFSRRTLLRLALEIPERGMDSLRRDPRQYVAATLRDGNTTYSNVAVHLKGSAGSFRRVDDRPGLTLNFDYLEPDGPRFHGLKKVHLNNSVQDPSRLSEWVAGQMFREAGVPAARAAHALLELNGHDLGLYVILESMNKDFFGQYLQNPRGSLYGQPRRGDVMDDLERMEGNEPLTRAELKALAEAAREEDVGLRLERLDQTLDLDRFLSFMALESILCHWDGYTIARHNYRLYHDLDTDRVVFLPHDLDQLMVRQNVGLVPRAGGLVAQAVLNTPTLSARYRQRVCSLATNLFVVPRWTSQVDQAAAALLPALQAADASLAQDFARQATQLKGRMISRGQQMERQLAILAGTARPLSFSNEIGRLPRWAAERWQDLARAERTSGANGRSCLWISADRPAAASWRTRVLLEPGRYRFEGLARCAGLEMPPRRKGGGACLMVSGVRPSASSVLQGDTPWQKLACELAVAGLEEVECPVNFARSRAKCGSTKNPCSSCGLNERPAPDLSESQNQSCAGPETGASFNTGFRVGTSDWPSASVRNKLVGP